MGRQRKPRSLAGILKDKASLLKALLSLRRATSSIQATIIRATAHGQNPTSDHHVAAVLAIGEDSRQAARACVAAIMDRLHSTRDARVALKCLTLLHYIIAKGSSTMKEQLSVFAAAAAGAGGWNFLNLSRFRDGRDVESWNLSSWVRWYAGFLETSLKVSRMFKNQSQILEKDSIFMDELVKFVEEICDAPDPDDVLLIGGKNLTNEITSLVVEDYGSTQRQIGLRLGRIGDGGVDSGEAGDVFGCLKRMEDCREKLGRMFGNRKRNDEFWERVSETKAAVEKITAVKRIAPPCPLLALPYRNSARVSLPLVLSV